MGRKTILLIALLFFAGLCFGAAVTSDPWTGVGWNTGAPNDEAIVGYTYKELWDLRKGVELRANREHVTYASGSAGGWHRNGSAVCYEGTTEEPNLPDDSAALSNIDRDRGRLWLDDNFDPPVLKRWDGSAFEVVGTIASGSAPIAYLISDANEDTDGGRESKIIFKGEKDDDTSHELIMIQGSHDGTGDDYKADLILFLNDGDDADGSLTEVLRIDSNSLATFAGAASITGDFAVNTDKFTVDASDGNTVVVGTLDVTGNIDPTTYETTNGGFLDEDDMASDANDNVASQQSIKKYVDDTVGTWDPNITTGISGDDDSEGTATLPNGMIMKWGKVTITTTTPKAVTFADETAAFPTKCFQVIVCHGTTGIDCSDRSITVYTISKTGFTARCNCGSNSICRWFAIGR